MLPPHFLFHFNLPPSLCHTVPIDGTLEVYADTANFKAAFYEKPIYADVEKQVILGNAL